MSRKFLVAAAVAVAAGGGVFAGRHWPAPQAGPAPHLETAKPRPVGVAVDPAVANTLTLNPETVKSLSVRLEPVRKPSRKDTLTLTGSLFLDANRLAYVHSRFAGEVVEIGTTQDGVRKRPVRVGDHVAAGQVLAVLWSKEIGEKKSDLVAALVRLKSSKATVDRLESLSKGTVATQVVFDARRQYEADQIEVDRAERTLRSWRETEDEIAEVHHEAERIGRGEPRAADGKLERTWANVEIRAPLDGVLLEQNVTAGEIVETADDLFKVADLSRMGVLANVYEEDLPRLLALPSQDRRWAIRLKAEPDEPPIEGRFDVVGNVIDPGQHTAAVIGRIDNSDGRLRVGQFVTATVELPAADDVVAVPNSSVIDDGEAAFVFVADDPHAHRVTMRRVEIARRGRDVALIRRAPGGSDPPLREGELVVAAGNLELFGTLQNAGAIIADEDTHVRHADGAEGADAGRPSRLAVVPASAEGI